MASDELFGIHSSLATRHSSFITPMNNHRIEFRIGVVVLVALVTLIFLVVWFGKQSIVNFGEEYTLKFLFESTPGVKVNTPVLKNGIQIGRVSKISLVDEDRAVEVSIRLPTSRKIYTNEECRVRQRMIMGDSMLEFVKVKKFSGKIEVLTADSPPQPGGAAVDLLGGFSNLEGDLQKAIANVSDTAETMSAFIGRINSFVGSPDEMKQRQAEIQEMVREMMDTMRSLHKLTDSANMVFSDPVIQTNTKKIIQDLPDILEKSRHLLAESDTFLKELRAAVARGTVTLDKVDQGLDDLRQLGNDGTDTMKSIQSAANKIDSFVGDLGSILSGIGSSDTPLLQRVLQPEVAENLRASLENIRSITEQFDLLLRNDVKPITHNVKIITDKVARDPSVFIRNLVRKQPPIKSGLPYWGDGLGSDSLDLDDLEFGTFQEGTFRQDEETVYEPVTLHHPAIPTFARRRSATISERISSLFSVVKSPPKSSAEPSQYTELVADVPPPLLQAPKNPLPQLPQNEIPDEGRIICVDPRYAEAGEPAPYRQTSYSIEVTETPKLVFSKELRTEN